MLTNETLRKIADEGGMLIGMNDVRPMARELLTLRSIRDAGYEEVDALAAELANFISEQQDSIKVLVNTDKLSRKLRDIAIIRGQQLWEAREEIEQLKEEMETSVSKAEERANERGRQIASLTADNAALLKQWNDLDLRNEQRHREWNERILTLTAERDQWKEQCESECQYGYLRQDELDAVKAELAALRSAPGMAEVDAILNDVNSSMFANQERLSNIARQAIASRDEVVGLLTTAVESITGVREALENVVAYKFHALKADATRILEVVEGK